MKSWEHLKENQIGVDSYECDGWTVFSNGMEWKVRNPEGTTYAACYAASGTAMRNAEKKIAMREAKESKKRTRAMSRFLGQRLMPRR